MRVLVVYESEFGATRKVAEEVARGIRDVGIEEAELVDSRGWNPGASWNDRVAFLVMGVPTHARTLPTPASRRAALAWPKRPGSTLQLEPGAADPGIREWLASADLQFIPTAVFATRRDLPRLLTGNAGRRLARLAELAGGSLILPPTDFLVKQNGSVPTEQLDLAYAWGRELAARTAASALTE
jgi:hypothetical protein